MSNENIIRAWKDEGYRSSLGESERAALPPNPAGIILSADAKSGYLNLTGNNTFLCCSWVGCNPTPLCGLPVTI